MSAGIDLRYMWNRLWSFASHVWSAKWEAQSAPNEHIGVLTLTNPYTIPKQDRNLPG
jgi:hypothetical protein